MAKKIQRRAAKVIKYCASVALYTLLLGVFSPVLDFSDPAGILNTYKQPSHWILCLVSCLTVYNILLYFKKINPRKMYYCIDGLWATIAVTLSCASFIGALVLISVLENTLVKASCLIGAVIAYLLLMYIFVHRGIAVYSRGKIRIFKFVIRTYNTDRIDDVRLDCAEKKCTVYVTVQGNIHSFRLSPSSALRFEKRIRSICTPTHRS